MNCGDGDIAIDMAGERPPFHPHITAPYLRTLLASIDRYRDIEFTYIITIRNPLAMLWSYYKYFRPDRNSRYTFSDGWDGGALMAYDEWLLRGRVGADRDWLAFAPSWISDTNLSTLSYEMHALDADRHRVIDHTFPIEEPAALEAFLGERLETEVRIERVNQSHEANTPTHSTEMLKQARLLFPYESVFYGI